MTFLAMLDLLEIELSSRVHMRTKRRRDVKISKCFIAASAAAGEGSGKSKPATTKPTCRDFLLTENGDTHSGQCSFLHRWVDASGVDQQNMRLLSANGQDRRRLAFPPKGKGKSSPPKAPPPKANNNKGGGKGNTGAKAKNQSKPQGEATPKPNAEAGRIEIDWASQTHSDPFASSSVTIEEVTMHLADGTFLQSDHTASTFYTTFLPSFHLLFLILELHTAYCHLVGFPLTQSFKRIHLKVASGTSVRALLYNNIIYCSTVSRPLISVGQLKAMLDLRFHWRDSSPTLLVALEVSGTFYSKHRFQDPEMMFFSLTQPDVLDGSSNHLSSTGVIHNLNQLLDGQRCYN